MPQKADSTLNSPAPVTGPQCLKGGAQALWCPPSKGTAYRGLRS